LLGNKKDYAVNRERAKKAKLSPHEIDIINEEWMDNEMTSMMYQLIASDAFDELSEMLMLSPQLAHIRSEDGRGPMWWAHEFKRPNIIKMLKTLGVSESRTDENGLSPLDI
jgi:dolichyl-diphosphooligosaccharide--protein glycosyltransferase